MITSTDAVKAFGKIQSPFIIKTQQTKNRRNFLNLVKNVYRKSKANFLLNGEEIKAFLLGSETRQGHPFLPLLLDIFLEVPVNAIR